MKEADVYARGKLVQAAQAVLISEEQMMQRGALGEDIHEIDLMQKLLINEMLRVANSVVGHHCDWGDPRQLAALIVFTGEGYAPSICHR